MDKKEVGIIGFGGQAREVEQYLRDAKIDVPFFAINKEYMNEDSKQVDILAPGEFERLTPVIAAIGAPEIRRRMVEEWKGEEFYTVVSQDAYVGESVSIGEGSIIAPRAVLTASIELGKHVLVNTGATVAHDCRIGNFATVGPGAHIGGGVEIGDGVFVGIGAIISNNLKIADGSVIGAGSVVIDNILEPNTVVVGVPARVLRVNNGWLNEL